MIFVKMGGPGTSKNRAAERLGGVLGGSWGNLGTSWALLEAFWASWRGLGGILDGTWGILEGFGVSWRRFGSIMRRLGSLSGGFWEVLAVSRDDFGSILGEFPCVLSNL